VDEGQRKGEFLYSQATVQRAHEFFLKTLSMPYRHDVPIGNTRQQQQVIPGR
jgi:hypothetical protein